MGTFRVEPEQIFHEEHVELLRFQELGSVEIHKLFLDRPVEPLAMGIHLRGLGVGVVMGEMEFRELLCEVLLELGAIVREDVLEGHREDHAAEREELLGGLRGMGGRGPREPEPAVDILEGDDVPAAAVDEPFHGVERNAVPRMQSLEVLGFPEHLLAVGLLHLPEVADLLREDPESTEVGDDPADCGDGGDGKGIPPAEPCQQNLELRFPEIRMRHADPFDLIQHRKRPGAESAMRRHSRLFLQGHGLPMSCPKLPLPEEERPPRNPEGIQGRKKAVLLPEHEDLKLLLGFARHMLPPYRPVVAGHEAEALECRLEASSAHGSW
ncbi:MAG: hypothetical protein AAB728_04040 [Patescibacteria group bacterium]